MAATEHCDVAVIGAGPSGLTAALLLAKRGHHVTLLERWQAAYPLPRAVGFDWETCRTFQDLGIMERMLEISTHGRGYHWMNADGETLLFMDNSAMGPTGWPRVNNFSQPQLEQVLREAVAEQPLISLRGGVEVEEIIDGDDGVIVRSHEQLGNGTIELGEARPELFARFVIGADGANSRVREAIGTDHTDLGFFYDWLVIDVYPKDGHSFDLPDEGVQICDPAAPTTMVHGGPGRRRWEFLLLPGEDPRAVNTDAEAWRRIAKWGITPDNAVLERRTIYRFQARWANTWNKGHLVLAGDAAHLMPPFAGQGMNSGIRDAVNVAWKLDLILTGRSPLSILDSVTQERGHHVQHAIAYSVELGKVICIVDPELARERDARMVALGGDQDRALPKLPDPTFIDGIVHKNAVGETRAPSGHVAPQFEVAVDGAQPRRFDDVYGRPAAFVSTAPVDVWLANSSRALLDELGYPVLDLAAPDSPIVDVTGGYRAELERLGVVAALIRPDGYYFGVAADEGEIDELVRDYAGQLGLVAQTV